MLAKVISKTVFAIVYYGGGAVFWVADRLPERWKPSHRHVETSQPTGGFSVRR